MKKVFSAIFLSALFTTIATAHSGPTIEPGPVQKLSDDAGLVTRILLDRQVKGCIAKIQNSKYEVSLSQVTLQAIAPGKTKYQFSGVALQGGDVAVGEAVLTVIETEDEGLSITKTWTLDCTVSLPK